MEQMEFEKGYRGNIDLRASDNGIYRRKSTGFHSVCNGECSWHSDVSYVDGLQRLHLPFGKAGCSSSSLQAGKTAAQYFEVNSKASVGAHAVAEEVADKAPEQSSFIILRIITEFSWKRSLSNGMELCL
ncbi:hypothetical protein [Planomicrobium sp. CPCC 101110]|uniref:hypothetical protein n=1 Tax=Planomicrobium sp. CPCC 101110 TaxID=2599619 RepID=UPI0011B637D9|nr:hypothetical protein [Planomicrobium sp. CPCC 101110]TWT24402.1 hypothetical protein FQV30_16705 [Planomicrobium sp. CPCC 101110]